MKVSSIQYNGYYTCSCSNASKGNVYGKKQPDPAFQANLMYPKFINSINGAGIRQIKPNSYITVSDLRYNDCKILKDNGIERIIDLANYRYLPGNAKQAGVDYHFIDILENSNKDIMLAEHDIFSYKMRSPESSKKTRTFVDKFIELINLVKKDNVFVCTDNRSYIHPCGGTSGFYDLILAFDGKKVLHEHDIANIYIADIYKNLTVADKKVLGFDTVTDKKFRGSLPLSKSELDKIAIV